MHSEKQTPQGTPSPKKRPVPKRSYKDHLKPVFLEAYKKHGTQQAACQVTGVDWNVVNGWRHQDKDFDLELKSIDIQSTQRIETSALNRAANGNVHFKFDKHENPVYVMKTVADPEDKTGKKTKQEQVLDDNGRPIQAVKFREFDTTLQIFMLKSRDPKYREVIRQEVDVRIIQRVSSEIITVVRRNIPPCCPNCKTVLGIGPRIAEELDSMSARLMEKKP